MKCRAKVLKIKGNQAAIALDSRILKVGDKITVHKGSRRTLPQNSFYWVYLNWLINNGMSDLGHYSADALHNNLKAHFLADKIMEKGQFEAIEDGTTTTLNRVEFGLYIDKINEFMIDEFKIDTSPFFEEYDSIYKIG